MEWKMRVRAVTMSFQMKAWKRVKTMKPMKQSEPFTGGLYVSVHVTCLLI